MTDFTGYSSVFGGSSPKPVEDVCEPCPPKKIPLPTNLTKIVTGICITCHPETGKPWLVQDCVVWDAKGECWNETSEGVYELPVMYKASSSKTPVKLPSFDGKIEVYTPDGPAEIFGGEATPVDMIGGILCINDELCYLGDKPVADAPVEVECGGDAPAIDSGVKLWIDNGIAKYPTPDGWVQTKPFGA